MLSCDDWLPQFEARLLSALSTDGFQRFAPRHYGRIRDDILQFLVSQPESGPRRVLTLEFASLLLVEPHSFLNLDLGGRFPDGDAGKVYVVGADEANVPGADNGHAREIGVAVEAVVIDYLSSCRPVLERASHLKGFIAATAAQLQDETTPHPLFSLAAAYARAGALDDAEEFAIRARDAYVASQTGENHPWAARGEQRCSLLLNSLYAGTTPALQDGWRAGTIAALGVESLVDDR